MRILDLITSIAVTLSGRGQVPSLCRLTLVFLWMLIGPFVRAESCLPSENKTCVKTIIQSNPSLNFFKNQLQLPQTEIRKVFHKDLQKKNQDTVTGVLAADVRFSANRYFADVRFGKLSKEQFLRTREYFSNFYPIGVEYSSAREDYSLIDFLPPSIRAFANTRLNHIDLNIDDMYQVDAKPLGRPSIEEIEAIDPSLVETNFLDAINASVAKTNFSVAANCWGTVLETLKHILVGNKGVYNMFIPSRLQAAQIFKDPKNFSEISYDQLKPGDVIVLYGKADYEPEPIMLHAAIFLAPGLIYEKTNQGDFEPFRLGFFDDLALVAQEIKQEQGGYEGYETTIKYFHPLGIPPVDRLLENWNAWVEKTTKDFGIFSKKATLAANGFLPPAFNKELIVRGEDFALGGGSDDYFTALVPIQFVEREGGRPVLKSPDFVWLDENTYEETELNIKDLITPLRY